METSETPWFRDTVDIAVLRNHATTTPTKQSYSRDAITTKRPPNHDSEWMGHNFCYCYCRCSPIHLQMDRELIVQLLVQLQPPADGSRTHSAAAGAIAATCTWIENSKGSCWSNCSHLHMDQELKGKLLVQLQPPADGPRMHSAASGASGSISRWLECQGNSCWSNCSHLQMDRELMGTPKCPCPNRD